jgi:hypothetical protein
MTRRGVQSLDPQLDSAIATLSKETQERLNLLRIRLLLAPSAKRWLGRDIDELTEEDRNALRELESALRTKESR